MSRKTIFIASIGLSLVFSMCSRHPKAKTGMEGKPLPSFTLLLPDSTSRLTTDSIQKGTPIILFYFSPYCPYCRAEMRNITDNMAKLSHIRFYVFTSYPFPLMKEFYTQYHLNRYKNITAGVDDKGYFSSYYKIKSVPFLAVYDKDKLLRHILIDLADAGTITRITSE
jgi:thiol-disulfide isomerase/thioredoxin